MAKNQNTFAKRAREMDKKRKADEKRANRRKKKERAGDPQPPAPLETDEPTDEANAQSL
jgi:hypothetical protein